ncbi:MAG: hypothetical protein V7L22_03730 [Nostoc sp.]|uniref:hypothetical protein n=1 Tax=Nostoc sp. TaxID=1180 RepID=UPI002FF5F63D
MNLTEIKPADIITHIEQNFNRSQATGLNCLIFLALREGSDVAHHWNEWGFADIPQQVIAWCDELQEDELLEVATAIINGLLDEIITAARDTGNAQRLTPQAIDHQKQPSLLSDY